ncbi:TetR/AcrR family transcriptional regulator [Streptomyces sp. NPDC000134]|uniref:TetR/AcrR family transcriptional regulator n=2 Tax=unclassified Streptomyces TaxID=2593676 RepID=UPI0036B16917
MAPRSARANQEMREQSRERILVAALEVFAEKGYQGATVSEITTRAGVSRGLLNYYFPGKHQLVDELLARYLDGVVELVMVDGGPDERLAAIIDRVLLAAVTTAGVQRMTLSLVLGPATHPLFAAAEARKEERVAALEDALRSLFAERGAADPALEEVLLRSVLEGVIFKIAVYAGQYPVERIRRRLYALYGLGEPVGSLTGSDPPPVGRMRAASATEAGPADTP